MAKSLLNKVKNIYQDDRSFTNTETGELIEYRRLAIVVTLDGEDEVLEFVPSSAQGKAGFTLLRVADDVKKTVDGK